MSEEINLDLNKTSGADALRCSAWYSAAPPTPVTSNPQSVNCSRWVSSSRR